MQKPEEKYIYKYGEKGLGKFQVLEMAEYPDGTLYLGTYGTGLYKFNPRETVLNSAPFPISTTAMTWQ